MFEWRIWMMLIALTARRGIAYFDVRDGTFTATISETTLMCVIIRTFAFIIEGFRFRSRFLLRPRWWRPLSSSSVSCWCGVALPSLAFFAPPHRFSLVGESVFGSSSRDCRSPSRLGGHGVLPWCLRPVLENVFLKPAGRFSGSDRVHPPSCWRDWFGLVWGFSPVASSGAGLLSSLAPSSRFR